MQTTERDVVHIGMHVDGMPRYNEIHIATNKSQQTIDVRFPICSTPLILTPISYSIITLENSVVSK